MNWKANFFEAWSWFKLHNKELDLGMTLNFYSSVAKGLKPKFINHLGLTVTLEEATEEVLELSFILKIGKWSNY